MIPHPSMVPAFVGHVCLGLVVAFVLLVRWGRSPVTPARGLLIGLVTVATSAATAWVTAPEPSGFSKLLVWSWTLAIVTPATLFGIALRANPHRPTQLGFLCAGLLVLAGAVYAFAYEPRNLEISHHRVVSPRLRAPLRIAVIADLQTDAPGDHERAALKAALEAAPDLIVFVCDVIQHRDEADYADAWATLRGIAEPLGLHAPLGVYLVEGDSEYPHAEAWIRHAEAMGLAAWPRETASRGLREDVVLTGFGLKASSFPGLEVERPGEGFHIVFGHRPAFALGEIDADLLLAGHTHGGQVQIPGWGPILTLSKVPRAWASGRTRLPSGATLLVSRGVGMERAAAPRIRFWCRPEVLIIDAVPAG